MKKFFKILLQTMIYLCIAASLIYLFILSISTSKIPELTVKGTSNTATAYTGNYTWNAYSEVKKQNSLPKEGYVFKTENILRVAPNEVITLSSSAYSSVLNFYVESLSYEDSSGVYKILVSNTNSESNIYKESKSYQITCPEREDTYTYFIKLNYYQNGSVEYGFKVVVSTDPTYDFDKLLTYKATSLFDYKSIEEITNSLPYSQYVNSYIIKTSDSPCIEINYQDASIERDSFFINAISYMTLIPELQSVEYKSELTDYIFTREELELKTGRKLSEYASNSELLKNEMLYKEEDSENQNYKVADFIISIVEDALPLDLASGEKYPMLVIDLNSFEEYLNIDVNNIVLDSVINELNKYSNLCYDMTYLDYLRLGYEYPFISLKKVEEEVNESGEVITSKDYDEILVVSRINKTEKFIRYQIHKNGNSYSFIKE